MKQVYTTGQVAKICGVAPSTVLKWCNKGGLGNFRIPASRTRRVPREQLVKFLNEHDIPLGELEADGRSKVLVIGAGMSFAAQMTGLLPENAYRLDAASDGFGAGVKTQETYYDTVVIDLAMGRSEALHIAKRLRCSPRHEKAFIIALAGEDEADPEGLSNYGFSEAFKKPFDVAQLAERLRTPPDERTAGTARNRFGPPLSAACQGGE